MKIILSRKGFDSKYGGVPSPIMPDGTLLSLPIPNVGDDKKANIEYKNLQFEDTNYAQIIAALRKEKKDKFLYEKCHLTPFLRKELLPRSEKWQQGYRQSEQSLSHLLNQKVEKDDLFLFFGWFRDVEKIDGKYQYVRNSKGRHIIFGYLQVGDILANPTGEQFPWSIPQEHLGEKIKNKAFFVARPTLSWDETKPGAGVLKYKPELVLTKEGMPRSCWKLDDFMNNEDIKISFHNENSWRKDEKGKVDYFKSAEIGQEFVISSENKDLMLKLQNWASNLIGADSSKL